MGRPDGLAAPAHPPGECLTWAGRPCAGKSHTRPMLQEDSSMSRVATRPLAWGSARPATGQGARHSVGHIDRARCAHSASPAPHVDRSIKDRCLLMHPTQKLTEIASCIAGCL
jgi:hypothetical protein